MKKLVYILGMAVMGLLAALNIEKAGRAKDKLKQADRERQAQSDINKQVKAGRERFNEKVKEAKSLHKRGHFTK